MDKNTIFGSTLTTTYECECCAQLRRGVRLAIECDVDYDAFAALDDELKYRMTLWIMGAYATLCSCQCKENEDDDDDFESKQ